jgi:hypothetical protein
VPDVGLETGWGMAALAVRGLLLLCVAPFSIVLTCART